MCNISAVVVILPIGFWELVLYHFQILFSPPSTIPVAPAIAYVTKHLTFPIRWMYICIYYSNFYILVVFITLFLFSCQRWHCYGYQEESFIFIVFNFYVWLVCLKFSVFTHLLHSTVVYSCSHNNAGMFWVPVFCSYNVLLTAHKTKYYIFVLCQYGTYEVTRPLPSSHSLHNRHLFVITFFKIFLLK
jgi:hypothetical protein